MKILVGMILAIVIIRSSESLGLQDMFELVKVRVNAAVAAKDCRSRGFDGLAVISSPEEFNYLIRASENMRKTWGLWVALYYNLGLQKLVWDDGTEPAPNMPWLPNNPAPSATKLCNRIHASGVMGSLGCGHTRYYICGFRTKTYLEAIGTVRNSMMPNNITSTLASVSAASLSHCAVHCSKEHRCSAALFQSVSASCHLVDWDGISGGLQNSTEDQKTFVRVGYVGYV